MDESLLHFDIFEEIIAAATESDEFGWIHALNLTCRQLNQYLTPRAGLLADKYVQCKKTDNDVLIGMILPNDVFHGMYCINADNFKSRANCFLGKSHGISYEEFTLKNDELDRGYYEIKNYYHGKLLDYHSQGMFYGRELCSCEILGENYQLVIEFEGGVKLICENACDIYNVTELLWVLMDDKFQFHRSTLFMTILDSIE